MSVVGWFLGHAHKGRQFAHNIHSSFAPFVAFLFIGQVVFGIYLKFHWEKGINKYIRKAAVLCHGTIGKITPIVSWVQMGFGGITLLGFCQADHLGQVTCHSRSQVVDRSVSLTGLWEAVSSRMALCCRLCCCWDRAG